MIWTVGIEEQLRALWAQGVSAREIAAELGGMSRNAVIGKARRLRLPPHGEPGIKQRRSEVDTGPARIVTRTLLAHHCRYPFGAPGTGDFYYCAEQRVGPIYCAAHENLCYRPAATPPPRRGA